MKFAAIILAVLFCCFSQSNSQNSDRETTHGLGWACTYEACPVGWSKQSWNKCFKMGSTKMSYDEAEKDCVSQDALLAIPRSERERFFLMQLSMRDAADNLGLWMGAIKRGLYWFTSDHMDFTWNSWVPGEPDFGKGACVGLLTNADASNQTYFGRMEIQPCEKEMNYACQKRQAYFLGEIVCGPREVNI